MRVQLGWALVVGAALSGCLAADSETAATAFTVDPPPAFVRVSPVTITGTKAKAHGVWLNDRPTVPVSQSEIWSLSLALDRGEQLYRFKLQEGDTARASGDVVDVEIALDLTAPRLAKRVPTPNATGVGIDTQVTATFTESLDCTTVSAANFVLFAAGSPVAATVTCTNVDFGSTLTLTPSAPLSSLTAHVATLFPEVADRAGNLLAAAESWQFETIDMTPPDPPTFDDPPPPATATVNARLPVGGAKDAYAAVEYQWTAGSTLQTPWTELAGHTGDTWWSHTFALALGGNLVELRAVDLVGNPSAVVSFTVVRDPYEVTVEAPTLDPVTTPSKVRYQVLTGSKPVGTSVWNGAVELVAPDAAGTWSALARLAPGANDFALVAKDAADNASVAAATQTIVFDNSWGAVSGGSLTIALTLKDLWEYIGDEFNATTSGNDIDHFGIDIWVEGPFSFSGDAPSYTFEDCRFEGVARKHTRYVTTIARTAIGQCITAQGADKCYGLWGYDDYRNPNYLAALIESGKWASTVFPIPPGTVRRDPNDGRMWRAGQAPGCDNHLWFFNGLSSCLPRMMTPWVVDGETGATVSAVAAQASQLGSFTALKSYTWDLRDHEHNLIEKGPYLIAVVITVDRSVSRAWAGDQETCWSNSAHDAVGSHRAEKMVMLDGATGFDEVWPEKGLAEQVSVCQEPNSGNFVTCSCSQSDPFPCPQSPNGAQGSSVRFLQDGVHVRYDP
ncbi:MAG: Ig-like domain-containing protein [Deltaproteobacteria bacterium]|nr:Ig-like domain-containing protein [Deltaproteobacteria bacterium]